MTIIPDETIEKVLPKVTYDSFMARLDFPGLIPQRLKVITKKVCYENVRLNEERAQREDLREWGRTPNKPWQQPRPLGPDAKVNPIRSLTCLLP